MDWFKTVKGYFDSKLYNLEQVKVFVQREKITEEQYTDITGQEYTA